MRFLSAIDGGVMIRLAGIGVFVAVLAVLAAAGPVGVVLLVTVTAVIGAPHKSTR